MIVRVKSGYSRDYNETIRRLSAPRATLMIVRLTSGYSEDFKKMGLYGNGKLDVNSQGHPGRSQDKVKI